jgi:hypothetical protein
VKAISLWQPWASLWLSPAKVHETRHWPTRHRGWLVVHAAKRKPDGFDDDPLGDILDSDLGPHWGIELPRGALIGLVHIIACVPTMNERDETCNAHADDLLCGDFSPDRYAWRRDHFRVFDVPVPYRGQQGMFEVPDEIIPAPSRAAVERAPHV